MYWRCWEKSESLARLQDQAVRRASGSAVAATRTLGQTAKQPPHNVLTGAASAPPSCGAHWDGLRKQRPPAALLKQHWRKPSRCRRECRSAGRHNRGLDHGCEDRRQHQIWQIRRRRQRDYVPDLRWNYRSRGHRYRQILRRDRDVHLRSRLHLDRQLRVQDHLYRRRRRYPALSRISDRAARRARRFSRDLLSSALRRASDRRAESRLRQPRHAPHHGARADESVLSRFSGATRTRWQ